MNKEARKEQKQAFLTRGSMSLMMKVHVSLHVVAVGVRRKSVMQLAGIVGSCSLQLSVVLHILEGNSVKTVKWNVKS